MKVVELLPFYNEVDILLARITLMDGVVDRHVIAEGDLTHQGNPKPLYLDGAASLALPATVERHVAVLPGGEGDGANWARERAQRDALALFAGSLADDDLVLSCDLDELVEPAAVERIAEACEHGPVSLAMRMIYYGNREDPHGWGAAKAFRARHFPKSLTDLRLSRCPTIPACGVHLSYLGGRDRRRAKIEAFAHAENRQPDTWARIAAAHYGPNGETLIDFDPATLPPVLRALVQ
jgi:Glycosyltransferase family 17